MLFRIFMQEGSISEKLQYLVFALIALVIALTLREFARALVANLCGDPTSKAQGRLSLNPLRHIEPFGFVTLLLFGMGWAKPVNIRPSRFRHPRLGCVLTSAAGPASNFLQALIFSFFFLLCSAEAIIKDSVILDNLSFLLQLLVSYNVSLGIFNLIPIPPLDGSKIIGELLPYKAQRAYYSIEKFGFLIAFGIVILLDYTGIYDYVFLKTANAFINVWVPVVGAIIS